MGFLIKKKKKAQKTNTTKPYKTEPLMELCIFVFLLQINFTNIIDWWSLEKLFWKTEIKSKVSAIVLQISPGCFAFLQERAKK